VKPGSDAQRSSSAGKVARAVVRGVLWAFAIAVVLIAAVYTYAFLSQPKPGDYLTSVEPPQIRISQSRASNDAQEFDITVTNTGRKPTQVVVYEPIFYPSLSPGVFTTGLGTCKDQELAQGAVCKVKLVFKPEWLNAEERERNLESDFQVGGNRIPIAVTWLP
jgi:hypothetical protein